MATSTVRIEGVEINRNALRDQVAALLTERGLPATFGDVEDLTDRVWARLHDGQSAPSLNGLAPVEPGARWLQDLIVHEIEDGAANGNSRANGHADGNRNGAAAKGRRAATQTAAWDPSAEPEPPLSDNARAILEKRYIARDADSRPIEDAKGLFLRVARAIAEGERNFTTSEGEVQVWTQRFYRLISSLRFLPNSPTLVNAGKGSRGSLSACFVVSPEDDMESIMKVAHDAAMIEKWGGGIGFGFSGLRPKGDPIATTHGMACGPVAVMKLYSAVGATLTQGAFRLGAHMGQLSVTHPDILEFIHAKDDDVSLQNFNISVQVTDRFMQAVRDDAEWDLASPRTGKVVRTVKARDLWRDICDSAWKTGDPGLVFIDRVWETQPNPQLGLIQTSNPCGEEFLENYGNCCLGSIDLAKHVKGDDFDWTALEETVRLGVRFLDDVIEVNVFPIPELREMNLKTRRIGLGIMGWADALVSMGVAYDSDEALALARKVGAFIREKAWSESESLARVRGPFPEYERSRLKDQGMPPVRHSSVTTIAPTGTISRLADCSSGIEPHFALAWWSNILWEDHKGTSTRFLDAPTPVRRALIAEAGEERAEDTLRKLAEDPSYRDEAVDAIIRKHGVRTAMAIAPEWHVKMQAAWQENTTNSVSKTINLSNNATVEDIARAFWLAWETDCKAITVYRDGSKSMQVLETGVAKEKASASVDVVVQEEPSASETPRRSPRRRPQTLPAVTERIRTGHGNLYVTITFDEEGRPFEVFTNLGKAGTSDSAYLEAIGRLVSLSLRSGVDVAQVVDQLRGIIDQPTWDDGQQVLSAPDAVALALIRHAVPQDEEREELRRRAREAFQDKLDPAALAEPAEGTYVVQPRLFPAPSQQQQGQAVAGIGNGPQCPDCYNRLTFAEGCLLCLACGYSKC
jgi:ribonucleoside-diphosphate reductase alpha chain